MIRATGNRGRSVAAGGPVRVLHLVFWLRPGGMEHGVVKIVNGLDPAVVSSAICSTTAANPQMRSVVRAHVPVLELTRREEGNDPRVLAGIYRVIRRYRPHVLHTHAWGTLIEGLLAGRLARVPAIVHGEHGTLQLKPRQLRVQRWAWARVDQLLSVSSRLAQRMSNEVGLPLDRIRVIRNGVNLTRFRTAQPRPAPTAFGFPDDGSVVIGAVGRLVPVKDHAGFIDAIAILRSRGRRAVAVIAGDGPLRPELEARIARLGLQGVVRLLGHRADVETVLAGLDIFVQSSTSEGMSNTILEAMAAGLPVVTTAVGGADEMVVDRETGILVVPGSPLRLADAVDPLITANALREVMGNAARLRAHNEFSLEGMIAAYQTFYCDLMQQRMRGHQKQALSWAAIAK